MPSVADLLSAWESDPASVERAEAFWRGVISEGVTCDAAGCAGSGVALIQVGAEDWEPEGCARCGTAGRIHDPAAVVAWWLGQADMITMAGEDVLLYHVPAMRMLVWWEEAGHEIDSCPAPAAIDALLVALSRIGQPCSKCGSQSIDLRNRDCSHCGGWAGANGLEPCPVCDDRDKWRTACVLCCGTGSLGIVPGICGRCGKPSEAHGYPPARIGHVYMRLRCIEGEVAHEYEERPSPLASPWPRTETR